MGAILLAAAIAAHSTVIRCDQAIPKRSRALFSNAGVLLTWEDGVEVLDPRSGTPRWRQQLSSDSRNDRPVVVIGDRVILGDGDSLTAYSMEAGRLLWKQKRGWVRHLTATPHLLAHVTTGHRSKILRLDPATGAVLAARIARESESMVELSNVILDVQLPNESDGVGYVVVAYRSDDLGEIWRFRQTGAAGFVEYDGVPYFDYLSSLFPIDLKTGARGPKLPPSSPVDTMWGGSTRELETTDDLDTVSRIRRNDVKSGKPIWTADVPFDVLNTLRDGDILYVSGGIGMGNDSHYVAAIDWRDGTVKKVTGPVPFVFQWGKIGDSIVATTWDRRFICFSP